VQQALQADPFAGEVFIFRPRRGDRVKILVYDGTGLCLLSNDIRNPTAGDIENPATPVTLTLRPEPVPCWP
jgi:hypothetical protein